MVEIHDVTFRDAHQSLLATRVRTEDMIPIAERMDQVGFFSLEVWGGATFDVCLRYLAEDPWERLRSFRRNIKNTALQMLLRGQNLVGYRIFPDDIVQRFIELAYKNGVSYFRIFDALNDVRNLKVSIETAKKLGAHVQGALCYTTSPVHTVEYYVDKFKELEKLGCDSLCIKDMAGIMSPSNAYNIVRACKEERIKVPIDLHSHTVSGMAELSYMKACEAGVDILDCAISPLSGGFGHPPTESIVAAFKDTAYDTGYDLNLLMECRKYFLKVWDKYRYLHEDKVMKVDPSVLVHQIPGGMFANLLVQLEDFGILSRLDEVLMEVLRVREEFGWPPLVTPISQIVGVQAVMNVLFGRYKRIVEETKMYIKGMYGRPPGEIREEIYSKVLGPTWHDEIIKCRPADLLDPMYNTCKEELEKLGLITKEEDVISYALFPQQTKAFLSGKAKAEFTYERVPKNENIAGRRFRVSFDNEEYDVVISKRRADIWMKTE